MKLCADPRLARIHAAAFAKSHFARQFDNQKNKTDRVSASDRLKHRHDKLLNFFLERESMQMCVQVLC